MCRRGNSFLRRHIVVKFEGKMLKKFTVYFIFGLLLAVTLASCAKPKTETSVYYYDILKSPAK